MKCLRETLDEIDFVCEATHTEKFFLWKEFNGKCKWESDGHGWLFDIGEFGGMPVTIDISCATIDGKRILFYESPSVVSHFGMIEDWLNENLPFTMSPTNHTDAMNFFPSRLNKK